MARAEIVSVVMAAGRGSRMGMAELNKVCCDIGGEAVICRALRTYEECGVSEHVLVVGYQAEQVKAALSGRACPISFAYQHEQNGTGHAARCGAEVLASRGYDGWILVVAGDKFIDKSILDELVGAMEHTCADLAFVTGDRVANPGSGRVVSDAGGQPVAIVEASEIALSELLRELQQMVDEGAETIASQRVLAAMQRHIPKESKLRKACPELLVLVTEQATVEASTLQAAIDALLPKTAIVVPDEDGVRTLYAADVEQMTDEVNLSVYLFAAPALYAGLEYIKEQARICASNAQGEEYLTDVVKYLASARDDRRQPLYTLTTVKIEDPNLCMGFNTPEELQKIQDYEQERSFH